MNAARFSVLRHDYFITVCQNIKWAIQSKSMQGLLCSLINQCGSFSIIQKWCYFIGLKFNSWLKVNCSHPFNRTVCIRHQCRKTAVLSCHRSLIIIGVEKNEQHLNIDWNFDHQMSHGKSKCWYSNRWLHFKSVLLLTFWPSSLYVLSKWR